jgi:Cyclic nucleotide-binding domain/Major Facilitator Superfamily
MIRRALGRVRTSLQAVVSVFANPDMRRLQLAWGASSFAIWSFAIALGVYAFDVGGAAAVGIAGLVRLLPGALASPFAGLLGDRHSRRIVLLLSAVCGAAALGLAALAATVDAPAAVVFALAGLFTIATTPYVPAEGALLPVVARTPQELSAANVARSVMDNIGFLVGSVLTGVLLATTSPELVFGTTAIASLCSAALLAGLSRREQPRYSAEVRARSALRETARGMHLLLANQRMRVIGAALTLLVFFEGAVDVLVVIVALDLLSLGEGAVGYLNAAWGIGALLAAAPLAMLIERGRLAAGLVAGSLIAGAVLALPAIWVVSAAAYLAWAGMGAGYEAIYVAGRTLLQRLGSDETLGRVLGALETSRLAAMALGAIMVPGLIALVEIKGALIAIGAVLPLFALLRWSALRSFEIGAPVPESNYRLLRDNSIFAPLPVDALERLSRDVVSVSAATGQEIITQGDHGDRFYLIQRGQVEVFEDGAFRRSEADGESFGEIALIHDVPRTATVRAARETKLLALERAQFIAAVTGNYRSGEAAAAVAEERLGGQVGEAEQGFTPGDAG